MIWLKKFNKVDIVIHVLSAVTREELNPIQNKLWNYIIEQEGAIMARISFWHPEAARRQIKVQKWLESNFFDLQLSIETKTNTLWTIFLALLASLPTT